MFWLDEYTERIRLLLKNDDARSLTYAALEARLALERVCYERLRQSHNYISADDLRTWKPQYVVQTVMEMVDSKIASEWTLSMGSKPGDNPDEYITLGTQKGFDPKKINQLWQAMSSFLHTGLPKRADDAISHYKSAERTRGRIEETLRELERIAEGTLIGTIVPQTVTFECVCGQSNRRAAIALTPNSIVNCIKESCKEQYRVEIAGEEILFERQLIEVRCHKCGNSDYHAYRTLAEMQKNTPLSFRCKECQEENTAMWVLRQFKRRAEE